MYQGVKPVRIVPVASIKDVHIARVKDSPEYLRTEPLCRV